MKDKSKVNYVDNSEFLSHIEKLRLDPDNYESKEFVGKTFLAISRGVANLNNFKNYTYKRDMISDAALNCWLYMHNFDPQRSNNPFAYFTQIVWYAFIRYIDKEKKQQYIKYKLIIDSNNYLEFSDSQDGDNTQYNINDNNFIDNLNINLKKFIDDFESRINNKKEQSKKNKKKLKNRNLGLLCQI